MRECATMKHILSALISAALFALPAAAGVEARDGWAVHPTAKPYAALLEDVRAAVTANKMGLVTEAGPTEVARAKLGEVIPGNRVIGVYRPDFAVRAVRLSVAAMIEAPIRLYVTETETGATLSYKTPSFVFSPYFDEGGEGLRALAAELDAIFASIAEDAVE
jgi:uncharacterized protein (DUF302 family)